MPKHRNVETTARESGVPVPIPIPNLPKTFLWMHVKSGTKIRNVLNYALKEFSDHKSLVWSGTGQAIGKVITCSEVFKKKNPGLQQITKLRYVDSKKADMEDDSNANRRVPEIHILLSKNPLDPTELGHQSSVDQGLFLARTSVKQSITTDEQKKQSEKKLSSITTERFLGIGLRTGKKGRKRSHKGGQNPGTSSGGKTRKKSKKWKQGKKNN